MLTEYDQIELGKYRDLEQIIRENRDTLLTDVFYEKCSCSVPKTKRAFRCTGAFRISMILDELDSMRINRKV